MVTTTEQLLFFNEDFYLQTYSDVRISVESGNFFSGFEHFQIFGSDEQRDPNEFFDTSIYVLRNPDVKEAIDNGIFESALEHFIEFGADENRDPSAGFDLSFYARVNPEAVESGQNLVLYHIETGQALGNPTLDPAFFDGEQYLLDNPDVALAGIDPRQHYEEFGAAEGRDPGVFVNTDFYLLRNPDVAEAVEAGEFDPLQHILDHGLDEGRSTIPNCIFRSLEGFQNVINLQTLLLEDTDLFDRVEGADNEPVQERFTEHFSELIATATCHDTFSIDISNASDVIVLNPVVFSGIAVAPAPIANIAPTANNDSDTAFNNASINIDVLINDTDPDVGDILSVSTASTPSALGATVSINGAGATSTIDYDPTASGVLSALGAGATTVDTFTYSISDGAGGTDTATVTITVTGAAAINNPPVANNDTGSATQDGPVVNIDVLANDTDPDVGDTLTILSADSSTSQNASVSIQGAGTTATLDYDHTGLFQDLALGATTTDTFTYTLSDGVGGTDTATVTITITGINDDPTGNNDSANATQDGPVINIDVLNNDTDVDTGDTLSILSADSSTSENATVSIVGAGTTATLDYDHTGLFQELALGATTTDTFTYVVEDNNGGTDTATVTVTITGINDDPNANDDNDSTLNNATVSIDVLANDTDIDIGDSLTILSADTSTSQNASVSIQGAGTTATLLYDPTGSGTLSGLGAGATTTDTFTYIVTDGNGGTDSATVTVTITGAAAGPPPETPPSTLSSLNGANGIAIDGISSGDNSGKYVGSAGDINGDGFSDLVIGAAYADVGASPNAGETYVVFGGPGPFVTPFPLSTLNGSNGFRIDGVDFLDSLGFSADSAGDINGDGVGDLIIGAPFDDPGAAAGAGSSYVIFGSTGGFASSISVSTLNGTNGFRINGEAINDRSGFSVDSAGDINGDGFDDLIIGAYGADSNGSDAGSSYVVFGTDAGFGATLDLSTLNGTNGFRLDGAATNDYSGRGISSAGDVNGDGFEDIIIGADGSDSGALLAGTSYIVFGSDAGFASSINLSTLNGTNGIILNSATLSERSGYYVNAAGDVNSDGFDDVIIGGGPFGIGNSYVVFGSDSLSSPIDLSTLNGSNGFAITNAFHDTYGGIFVSTTGDINGDGFDDIITSSKSGAGGAGITYVIYGAAGGFASSIDVTTLGGSTGFITTGTPTENSGSAVTTIGDFDGDGFDDITTSAIYANPGGQFSAGTTYLIFGGNFTTSLTDAGTTGDDNLAGTGGVDVITGDRGDDTLDGGADADILFGGEGDDLFIFGDSDSVVKGGLGTDILQVTTTSDLTTVTRFEEVETITISGAGTNLTVSPLKFHDVRTATGNVGTQTITFTASDNITPITNTAIEVLQLSNDSDATVTLTMSEDNLTDVTSILGVDNAESAGAETAIINIGAPNADVDISTLITTDLDFVAINGEDGDNNIIGNNNTPDTINGGSGNDNIDGRDQGLTGDVLTGGAGDDTFTFSDLNHSPALTPDIITDFTQGDDLIDVSSLGITDISEFTITDNGSETTIDHNTSSFAIELTGVFTGLLTNADFILSAGGAPPPETPVNDFTALNGTNGFRLDGVSADDNSSRSVSSAGDINGDGFSDLIIGAADADPVANNEGSSYVVFGSATPFTTPINLSTLNGTNGFRLDGVNSDDLSGRSVSSAGDVNGDGIDDLIIGASEADPGGNSESGSSYVVFGSTGPFGATFDLSTLNGTNGFRLDGVGVEDYSGYSVNSAGDINGDGFDDIIIGAYRADPGGVNSAGSSYVVFGASGGFGATLDLSTLNGTNGFRLDSGTVYGNSGYSVNSAGDINGDGFEDLIIGADGEDPGGNNYAGSSYVVFGTDNPFSATFDLATLNGTNGFRVDGIASYDRTGNSVSSAGDINGDGFDDIIVGAPFASPSLGYQGSSYVVFGASGGFGATLDLSTLNGTNGFRLDGEDNGDYSGISVSSAGDVNGDGFDDLIIGGYGKSTGVSDYIGTTHIVFGGSSFAALVPLSTVTGSVGFQIDGVSDYDYSGFSVSGAGDIDGDGFDDLIISSHGSDPGGNSYAGSSYVLFGGNFSTAVNLAGTTAADNLSGTGAAEVIIGDRGDDTIDGGSGADTLIGAEGDDLFIYNINDAVLRGGLGDDTLQISIASNLDNITSMRGIENISISGNIVTAFGSNPSLLRDVTNITGDAGFQVIRFDADVNISKITNTSIETILIDNSNTLTLDEDNLTGVSSLQGGAGTETIIINIAAAAANINLSGLTVINLEGFLINGSAGANNIIVHDSTDDTVNAGNGNDVVDVGLGNDVIDGGNGNDTLDGGGGNDSIDGGSGDDSIGSESGDDTITDGSGNDTIIGGSGADVINLTADGVTDTIIYNNTTDGNALGSLAAATADSITNFQAGSDEFSFNDSALGLNGAGSSIVLASGTGLVNSAAAGPTPNGAVFYLLGASANDLTNFANVQSAIGSITIDAGDDLIFAVRSIPGNNSGLYYFQDQNGDSTVDANELALLGIVDAQIDQSDLAII